MNRLACMLTGGHMYECKNLIVTSDPLFDYFTIENHCVKCGKPFTTKMKVDVVMGEKFEEELRYKFGGGKE